MTKVISLASTRAGTRANPNAPTTATPSPSQQAAIENALSMALHFIRQPGDHAANLWAATARTHRALTLLKYVGEGNAPAHAANVLKKV